MLMLTQVLLPTREQQCGTGGASHPAGQVSSQARSHEQHSGAQFSRSSPTSRCCTNIFSKRCHLLLIVDTQEYTQVFTLPDWHTLICSSCDTKVCHSTFPQ